MAGAAVSGAKTRRHPLDFYPTPEPAVAVCRDWLLATDPGIRDRPVFLDPAAGAGAIIRAMREGAGLGESFWHAIEMSGSHLDALEDVAEDPVIADALSVPWPPAHVVANPPFGLLDAFWTKAVANRDEVGAWGAIFMPVAWWNAEKRRGYTPPDYKLALGWRPVFRERAGAGHKGSQDFEWAVLAPRRTGRTEWLRLEKPTAPTNQLALTQEAA